MGIFNSIKKSRRASDNIDEKIEYLNKELDKNGLREAMTTTGMYVATKDEPNSSHNAFKALSHDGQPVGFSGADYNIFTEPIGGLVYSPPHPVTGQRQVAQSYYGIASDFRPVPAGSDRQIMWVFDQDLSGGAGRYFSLELSRGDSPYWGMWIDTAFGTSILVPFDGDLSPLSSSMKTDLGNLNIGDFTDPNDFGPPVHTVAVKNDLGDTNFLPINIPGLSDQGFGFLKNQAQDKKDDDDDQDTKIAGLTQGDIYILQKGLDAVTRQKGYEAGKREQQRIMKMYGLYLPLASNPSPYTGADDGSQFAFFGKDKPVDPNKKQNRATTQNIINHINSGGFMPLPKGWTKQQAQQFYNNYINGTLSESLNEDVGIGHFEPEILNVDINDIRKGIMPEFPKDPPPEMVNGYNPNSRLAPKELDPAPFIKITRKDLAQNHKLTDKEITEFMNDIKMVNEYIKENPADLIYAQTRYPKHDPRLAQLNWQMDQMLDAGKKYMDKTFPENEKLFKKIQKTIKKNIELTDPKSFKDVEIPNFKGVNLIDFKRRKEVVSRHFKKAVKIERLFSNKERRNSIREERGYLNNESEKNTLKEVMTTSGMYFATRENPAIPAVTANVPDSTGVLGSGFTPPIGGNGNANDPSNYPAAYDTAWMYNSNDVDGVTNRPIVKTMDQSVIDAYNTAFPDDNRFPSGGAGIVFGDIAFGTGVGYASGGHYVGVLSPGLFGNGSTKQVPPGSPFGAPWFGMNGLYFPATRPLANVIMAMTGAYQSLGGYNPQGAMVVQLWRQHSTFHDGQFDNWSGKKYISNTGNRYVLQNFYMYATPNDYVKEPAVPVTTTVLYRNDLGDPSFLPIKIDLGDISDQAFQYLSDKATPDDPSFKDVYDAMDDVNDFLPPDSDYDVDKQKEDAENIDKIYDEWKSRYDKNFNADGSEKTPEQKFDDFRSDNLPNWAKSMENWAKNLPWNNPENPVGKFINNNSWWIEPVVGAIVGAAGAKNAYKTPYKISNTKVNAWKNSTPKKHTSGPDKGKYKNIELFNNKGDLIGKKYKENGEWKTMMRPTNQTSLKNKINWEIDQLQHTNKSFNNYQKTGKNPGLNDLDFFRLTKVEPGSTFVKGADGKIKYSGGTVGANWALNKAAGAGLGAAAAAAMGSDDNQSNTSTSGTPSQPQVSGTAAEAQVDLEISNIELRLSSDAATNVNRPQSEIDADKRELSKLKQKKEKMASNREALNARRAKGEYVDPAEYENLEKKSTSDSTTSSTDPDVDPDAGAKKAYYKSPGVMPWSYLDADVKDYWRSQAQASDPFANELKPGLGASDGDKVALFGKKPPNPNEKQGRGSHINIINYYQSDGMMGTKPEGWTDQDIQNYINKFYLNQQSSNTNANDDVKLAGTYDLMKRGQVPFLTPSQVDKILVDPKYQKLLQDDPDLLPILQRMRAGRGRTSGAMVAHYQSKGQVLSEGVGLGHFEPEQLNVNIEDLRKGIMPEFPKEAPPELINGYSSKSRLAPKKLERSSFIKITKKDLAKNHILKDSEIKDFMNKINAVNDFIKKHPEELVYAQTRYPKSDPRLAQLNWEMDQKLNASKQYMDKHYPENQRLFTKIQKSINKNIELTDPKSFKGVKIPKFKGVDLTDFKRRKAVVSRHFKKAIRKNKK